MAQSEMADMTFEQHSGSQAGSSRAPGDAAIPAADDPVNADEPALKKPKRKPRPSEPSDTRQPGTSIFPTARVQRILKVDEDMTRMSREAVFLTSIAAEQFVKRLASQGWLRARLAQKKLLTLDHLATVVKQEDEFHFLEDIIPQTVPLSVALAGRQAKETAGPNLPSYTPQTVQEIIPPSTLRESAHPDHPGVLAKNERGAHHRRTGLAVGVMVAGGALSKRRSSGGKAASPEQVKSASTARTSRRRSQVRETAEAEQDGGADATGAEDAGEYAATSEAAPSESGARGASDDEDVEMHE